MKPIFNQATPELGFGCCSLRNPNLISAMVLGLKLSTGHSRIPAKATAEAEAEATGKRYPGETKGFVEEMRFVAMRLHTRDQAKEGEKPTMAPEETSPAKWDPALEGYLRFLVDSKMVYHTLEKIVEEAPVDYYAEFRNTGLERRESLMKDLEWFKEQGHAIPEPSTPGCSYASYLEEISEKDPQAFLCHFYNIYFAHTAGGRMIGRKDRDAIVQEFARQGASELKNARQHVPAKPQNLP